MALPTEGGAATSKKPANVTSKPKVPLVPADLVVAAKKTTIADDRFVEFRNAQVGNKGFRTTTSFLVEYRQMTSGDVTKIRLVVRLGFSIPATEDEYPLFLMQCVAPSKTAPINGIVWLLSNDGLQIDAVSPIWGSKSCFGPLT